MSNIKERLEDIFREVFDEETLNLSDEMSAENIEGWDSLTHLQMIMEVEQAFNINFTTSQICDLKNVGELIKIIEEKYL